MENITISEITTDIIPVPTRFKYPEIPWEHLQETGQSALFSLPASLTKKQVSNFKQALYARAKLLHKKVSLHRENGGYRMWVQNK